MQIYTISPKGGEVRQLTFGEAVNWLPSFSPDGEKIAFCSNRDGNEEIYLMNLDGTNLVNLTNHPANDCGTPSWSPDGNRLVFNSNRDGVWENNPDDDINVYIMNADGSGQRAVTANRGYDLVTGQAWTPDGKYIIFCSSGDQPFVAPEGAGWATLYVGFEIYRIDADGNNQTRLTFTFGEDSYPNVSPDGKEIYYSRYLEETGTGYDIYRMTFDGKTVTRVTNLKVNEGPTVWSPDGIKIVFAVASLTDQSLYIANADGSNPKKLTNTHLPNPFQE